MRSRTMVFHPTARPLTADEAGKLVGAAATASMFGIELGQGVVASAEPIEKLGRPGLWITMESGDVYRQCDATLISRHGAHPMGVLVERIHPSKVAAA